VEAVVAVTLVAVVLEALVAVVLVLQVLAQRQLQELQTQVVAVVVVLPSQQLTVLLAAPALSSCPTPCQKAQSFNSCLLRHGKHQQASLPLTIWW
jgi:hypothetical protein